MPSLPEEESSPPRSGRRRSFDGGLSSLHQPLHSPLQCQREGKVRARVRVKSESGRRAQSLDFNRQGGAVSSNEETAHPMKTLDEGKEGRRSTGRPSEDFLASSPLPPLLLKTLRTEREEEKDNGNGDVPPSSLSPPSSSSSPPISPSSSPSSSSSSHVSSYRAAVPHSTRSFSPFALSIVDVPHDFRHLHLRRTVEDHHRHQHQHRLSAPTTIPSNTSTSSSPIPSCCALGPSEDRQHEDVVLRDQWKELMKRHLTSGGPGSSSSSAVSVSSARSLVWGGVPSSLRADVWSCWLKGRFPCCDMRGYMERLWVQVEAIQAAAAQAASHQQNSLSPSSPLASFAFPAPSPLWSAFADIEKDVSRTLPSQWLFRTKEGVASLRRVLLCFAVHCPVVGYCQGLNFIAGAVLLVTGGEEVRAFALLCAIVEGRMGYYTKSMAGCMVDTAVMADLASFYEPEMMALLSHYGLPLSSFCSSWFICLFCTAPLLLPHAMRVWDVLFLLGEEVLFRLGLALLRHAHTRLLAVNGAEELMQLFLQRMGEMESIEAVLSFMQQQWIEEPHLNQSIAALRDFHRYEVTATQSHLSSATVCRLQEQTTFDGLELQRLWELFIQPDPWQTISSGCIGSLVHFRYSFCAAVFHPNTSNQFKGRGLIIQPQPQSLQKQEETEEDDRRQEEEKGKAEVVHPGPGFASIAASTVPVPSTRRVFASTAGAVVSSSGLPPPSDLLSPGPPTWSSTATTTSSISPFVEATQEEGDEEKGGKGGGEGETDLTSSFPPHPPSLSTRRSFSPSASSASASTASSSSSLPLPPLLSSPPPKPALANHSSHFHFPSAVDSAVESIFADGSASINSTSFSSSSSSSSFWASSSGSSSSSSLFSSSAPSQSPLHLYLSSTSMSPFPCPSSTLPLSSPPTSPTGGRSQSGKGKGMDRGLDSTSWTSTLMGGGFGPLLSPRTPSTTSTSSSSSSSSTSSSSTSTSIPSPRRFPPRLALLPPSSPSPSLLDLQLPPSFSAHRAMQVLHLSSSSISTSSSSCWTLPPPPTLSHSSSQAALPFSSADPIFSATSPLPSTSSPPMTAVRPPSSDAAPTASPIPSISPSLCAGDVDMGVGVGVGVGVSLVSSSPCVSPMWSVLGRLFVMLDGLGRGCVDFDEFCLGVWLLKKSPRHVRLRAIFSMADVGGEGQLTREDLRQFIALFDALYQGKRDSGGSERDIATFVEKAFDTAKPSNLLNCTQFSAIAHLHPHIAHFFRL